jgi:hypothetical protein
MERGEITRESVRAPERIIPAPLIRESMAKRNELFEGRGLFMLSKEEFGEYFATYSGEDFEIRPDLQQGNFGDCYAVAAIHALSKSPYFETIVRASVSREKNGVWKVNMPLLNDTFETVAVLPEDLKPIDNMQFLQKDKDGKIDLRPGLSPVKGKEGLQVLETAYIKKKFGKVDRVAAEGGYSSEVLEVFGGNNFKRERIGGGMRDLRTGIPSWQQGLGEMSVAESERTDAFLAEFDPMTHIATASTKVFDKDTLQGKLTELFPAYKGTDTLKFFVPNHAYSISKVDSGKKMIELANPWETATPIDLTFEQFKGTFIHIDFVRVNFMRLLKNASNMMRQEAS